jgi:predicted MFS family arabinose efflux permease
MLAVKGGHAAARAVGQVPNMIAELREGWAEFRKHTWLWATVIQYCLVMMAWNGAFIVLGPVVARAHLGGAAGWGAISAADALGLVAGGVIALRYTPRRPMLFVVGAGGLLALTPLLFGLVAPLAVICAASFVIGALIELMMVQWTVAMATRIPSDKLARVSSYDAMGSLAAMPVGALVAGPLAAGIGVPATQFAAAALILTASALTLIPRDIWRIRSDDVVGSGTLVRELDLDLDLDTVTADPVPAAVAVTSASGPAGAVRG